MSKNNSHRSNEPQTAVNQNNQMSDDPRDGSRTSFVAGKDGTTPVEEAPAQDAQGREKTEVFGEQGGGAQEDKNV